MVYFDIINACGLLYHLPNPVLFLDILSVICKKKLILSTRITPENSSQMNLMRESENGNWWFPSEEVVVLLLKISGFNNIRILSINGDRSNIFCVADAPKKDLHESLGDSINSKDLLDYLILRRSPSDKRIVSKSSKNDLPEK